jgi:hypothetical protein
LNIWNVVFSTIIAALLAVPSLADSVPDPLFQDDTLLEVTITAPFNTIMAERPKDDSLPGIFKFRDASGADVKFDVDIRTRGHFRHETCDFPPLFLNFKKSQVKETLFQNQNKMKLVVHCDDAATYEQIVLREYLAYRILNAVTDESFRVRLLRVVYVNTEKKNKEQVRYAFLIEHKNRLGDRLGVKDLEIVRTLVQSIQPEQLNLSSIFEYLIGNTDFSPVAGPPGDECCHNYVLFGREGQPILAVPYDFDQSGFVDAPYALPDKRMRIRSVRQRAYRGRCVNNSYIDASLQRFKDSRAAIYTLIDEQEGLSSRTRNSMLKYVRKFYEIVDDPRKVEKHIVKSCLN